MPPQIGVRSVDALASCKTSLIRFRNESLTHLDRVELAIREEAEWLDERVKYWQKEIRVRENDVRDAEAELAAIESNADEDGGSYTDDAELAVKRARAKLRAAEGESLNAQRARRTVTEHVDAYCKEARLLREQLGTDASNSAALLVRLLEHLDAYIQSRS